MLGRAPDLIALRFRLTPPLALALALALLVPACGSHDAPEEASPLASAASIPAAAPGATGVRFEDPKLSGVATAQPLPLEAPTPLPSTLDAPAPLPLPVEPAPNPFGAPSAKPAPPKKNNDGSATGALPKGVQL